jgi:hypothetical protein
LANVHCSDYAQNSSSTSAVAQGGGSAVELVAISGQLEREVETNLKLTAESDPKYMMAFEIVPGGTPNYARIDIVEIDAEGKFSFSGIPAARYVLLAAVVTESDDPTSSPFQAAYLPGRETKVEIKVSVDSTPLAILARLVLESSENDVDAKSLVDNRSLSPVLLMRVAESFAGLEQGLKPAERIAILESAMLLAVSGLIGENLDLNEALLAENILPVEYAIQISTAIQSGITLEEAILKASESTGDDFVKDLMPEKLTAIMTTVAEGLTTGSSPSQVLAGAAVAQFVQSEKIELSSDLKAKVTELASQATNVIGASATKVQEIIAAVSGTSSGSTSSTVTTTLPSGTSGGSSSSASSQSTPTPSAPTALADSGALIDSDLNAGEIQGDFTWDSVSDLSEVLGWRLYWGSNATTKHPSASMIGQYAVADERRHGFAANTAIPSSPAATHILVFAYNEIGEAATPLALEIDDVGPPPAYGGYSVSSTNTVNKPANTSAGDVLVLVAVASGSGTSFSTPSGWTAPSGSGDGCHLFYKTAGGSEPASYTATANQADSYSLLMIRITNSSGLATIASDTTDSSTTAPAVTVTHAQSLLVAVGCDWDAGMSTRFTSYPAGMTGIVRNLATAVDNDALTTAAYKTAGSTGSSGTFVFGGTAGWPSRRWTLEFAP